MILGSPAGPGAVRVCVVSDATLGRSPDRVLQVVIEGLLAVDVPDADAATLRAVAAAAAAHAAGMPDLTRLGVRMVGALILVACFLPAGGHLARLPTQRRGRLLARFGRLPLFGDYIRLARGVGLVCYYERAPS